MPLASNVGRTRAGDERLVEIARAVHGATIDVDGGRSNVAIFAG